MTLCTEFWNRQNYSTGIKIRIGVTCEVQRIDWKVVGELSGVMDTICQKSSNQELQICGREREIGLVRVSRDGFS